MSSMRRWISRLQAESTSSSASASRLSIKSAAKRARSFSGNRRASASRLLARCVITHLHGGILTRVPSCGQRIGIVFGNCATRAAELACISFTHPDNRLKHPAAPRTCRMLWAYQQQLNPLNNQLLSTIFAGLPVITLFWLLVPRRWLAPKAAVGGAVVALLVAWLVYGMPIGMASMAFVHGAGFGLLPVGWTIFNAMLLYNVTVETGHFNIVRRSVAGLSGDARIQAILIGFAFGAFLEGAAGGGTPVAICGAIMVGLGFDPFLSAVLCLIANTSPVAYGGLGTPLITLSGVTDLPTERLSIMAGHQLTLLSFIVPLYMVKCMCNWKQTWEVWPGLLVSGGSFALFQFTFATLHYYAPNVVLYPMTDIGGGIFSLVLTTFFLKVWQPRHEWHFDSITREKKPHADGANETGKPQIGHAAEAIPLDGL